MKSIKEKAKIHAEFLSDSLRMESPLYRARMNSFEVGANYVLDKIETIIKSDLGSYKFKLDKIKEIIEQLKDNQ